MASTFLALVKTLRAAVQYIHNDAEGLCMKHGELNLGYCSGQDMDYTYCKHSEQMVRTWVMFYQLLHEGILCY